MVVLPTVEHLEPLRGALRDLLRDRTRPWPHVRYADVRIEVVEAKRVLAENGAPKLAREGARATLGVRVLAGDRAVSPGYVGLALGPGGWPELGRRVGEALEQAYRRAMANAEHKARLRGALAPLGASLLDTPLSPVDPHEDTVPPQYGVDPRSVDLRRAQELAVDVSRELTALDPRLQHNAVSVLTQLARSLFASTSGALIDQAAAVTQGTCAVAAVAGPVTEELTDTMGHQRGWEVLTEGVPDPLLHFPPFAEFARGLARDALELVAAPPLPSAAGEDAVVVDPHYTALLAHEIIGHPAELDRALKMEAAYAGRSWLLTTLEDHRVGERIASPLVTAYSDPALPGVGHYRYDHEGTPGRRVVHIEGGIFAGFMNSRQTAAVAGQVPNGHYTATDAAHVGLVRMSTTVFAAGAQEPRALLGEVERGWYLVGHRTPSIGESREHFYISARKVYELRHGRVGQLYRGGGLMADSRRFLLHVDGVGTDFRLYPIANCGKGQPMQSKRVGNGGPTLRSRGRVVGPPARRG
jgi:TldD protein